MREDGGNRIDNGSAIGIGRTENSQQMVFVGGINTGGNLNRHGRGRMGR